VPGLPQPPAPAEISWFRAPVKQLQRPDPPLASADAQGFISESSRGRDAPPNSRALDPGAASRQAAKTETAQAAYRARAGGRARCLGLEGGPDRGTLPGAQAEGVRSRKGR